MATPRVFVSHTMDRSVGLFTAATLVYLSSLVTVTPNFASPVLGLQAGSCNGRVAAGSYREGTNYCFSWAWRCGLQSSSALLAIGACAVSRRARFGQARQTCTPRRAVQMGSPADLFMQVLRDAAEKKGEILRVTKDVMKARKCLRDEQFLLDLAMIDGQPSASEYQVAAGCVNLMGEMQSTIFPKFVTYLAKKNRFRLLPVTLDHYMKTLYTSNAVEPVIVTSAKRLTDEQRESLISKLLSHTGAADIRLVERVNTELIAGFTLELDFEDPDHLEIPCETIDMSMQTHVSRCALKSGVTM